MKPEPVQPRRCAIYTRVSTEHGLDQAFNSLHAQREAAQAFVKSQAHEGWKLMRERYDDGGFSGASMERPALRKLLSDIRERRIDVVVVYKVDRLTRSLADFAKLVELFDANAVSFVSVTQAFNTTTSMGRLTLNVLLSFAQFEREVTGERIRDKIAASKKKGIWMGGVVPLGYRVENRALHIVEEHAALIRRIHASYLDLGSVVKLHRHLIDEGITVPPRIDGKGNALGGGVFSRGHLYKLLSNPIYAGDLAHRGVANPGEHQPIIARELWDQVQHRLADQTRAASTRRQCSEALLIGKLRDARGIAFSPSYAVKNGKRYRYYISRALAGGSRGHADGLSRLPAGEIEAIVLDALRRRVHARVETRSGGGDGSTPAEPRSDRELVETLVEGVVVHRDHLEIELVREDGHDAASSLVIPWAKASQARRKDMLVPQDATDARPLKAETRDKLLRAIARARTWLDELTSGAMQDTDTLAVREAVSERLVRQQLTLAFLAPDIVEAAIASRLPRGLGLTRLLDLPPSWDAQKRAVGLSVSATMPMASGSGGGGARAPLVERRVNVVAAYIISSASFVAAGGGPGPCGHEPDQP